jgi:hypothetical protein
MRQITPIDPTTYEPHYIHGADRRWAETNCYADVLIELIHSLGFEPVAALPFTIPVDFEVDQWTFFKFPHVDLFELFGMEIQELNPWRSLPHHIEEQVLAGRPVLVEVDSFYLPDTAGTAYRTAHVKSTVAVNEISIADRHMGYFHGQSYYHLDPENFSELFMLDGIPHDRMLPPYIELVKLHKSPRDTSDQELLAASLDALRRQLKLIPPTNPFEKFRSRFEIDLDWLMKRPIETFHDYSFATLRQYGACFELAETYLRWLSQAGESDLGAAIEVYHTISATAKAFQFRLARSIARQKPLDLAPIDEMARLWTAASTALVDKYGD